MACVYVYVIILAFLGPEYKGRDMGVSRDGDMQEATGGEAMGRRSEGSSGKDSGEKV